MRRSMCVALVLVASGGAALGQGPEIWAVRNVGSPGQPQMDPDGGTGARIIRFNASTPGTVTKVGNTGVNDTFFGLDALRDGRLIGLGRSTVFPSNGRLYTIDTATGAATQRRELGGIDFARWVPQDLAFDPFSNSLHVLASGVREFAIFRVDAETGSALSSRVFTSAANIGDRFLSLSFNSVGGAFVYNGIQNLFYQIPMGAVGFGTITAVPVSNPSLGGTGGPDVGAVIDWRAGNATYVGLFDRGGADGTRNRFYTLNGGGLTPTGGVTLAGTLGHGGTNPGDFLGFGDFAIVPVPATAGLVALGGLVLAGRRRPR